jgi:hypothetical protein
MSILIFLKKEMMRTLIIILLGWMLVSCVKSTTYSDIPNLEFRGFSKNTMVQGDLQQDSVTLVMFFTDGDGDFGTASNRTETNVFVKDLRTNEIFSQYKAPFVPLEGAGNGISGTIKIKVYTTCCIFPEDTGINPCTKSDEFPTNDLQLEVYIVDRAGNKSNTVKTDIMILDCK